MAAWHPLENTTTPYILSEKALPKDEVVNSQARQEATW